MVDAGEKSTAAPDSTRPGGAEVAPGLWLDSRLALVNRESGWLVAADVHFGYEVSRRAAGGLFPLWGMGTIEERFAGLLADHQPETVILAGDVVDGGLASREAYDWLESVRARCGRLVLVAGNHDRGEIRRRLDFVETFASGDGFFFHHGHLRPEIPDETAVEVIGHLHPGVSLSDGAGLRLRLPSLVQERPPDARHERWVLPAFSPWAAGGGRCAGGECRRWVCGEGRVFEWRD